MKKLLLASAITLAGLSAMVAVSYADVSTQRRNSKYCRLSNTTDVLCTGRKTWAKNAQAVVVTGARVGESRTKYCRQDSSEGDPICEAEWDSDPADYEDPVYE
jgi:hypothetical protein